MADEVTRASRSQRRRHTLFIHGGKKDLRAAQRDERKSSASFQQAKAPPPCPFEGYVDATSKIPRLGLYVDPVVKANVMSETEPTAEVAVSASVAHRKPRNFRKKDLEDWQIIGTRANYRGPSLRSLTAHV